MVMRLLASAAATSLLLFLVLIQNSVLAEEACGYSLCPATKEDHINVHIVPHTHDDVGWLKNIDQYYFGDANWYQTAGVEYILDSVVHALLLHPQRKFTYVEMAFFERWWRAQSSSMKENVHRLVRNGQLEFALGGWSMNDEAVVHYSDSIDQLTRGLAFLNATFGTCGRPRVAWQIDPFGHARQQARIFMESGFDGVFFQRMDYREKQQRIKRKQMEVLWRADPTDNATGLFTHMLFQSYCSPQGFCFDSKCNDPPIITDPGATNYNAPQRVSQFLDHVHAMANSYATNHIFVPMGCDFTYENANENFINMDRLIEQVNAQQQRQHQQRRSTETWWSDDVKPVNLLYSSPTCYTKAVNEAFRRQGAIPSRGGDFFPYASAINTYWTGYYSSRPTQKYMIRQASSLLSACEQAHLMKPTLGARYKYRRAWTYQQSEGIRLSSEEVVDHLRRMMGVMQHHDAVTGTEKQHVSDDYRMRLTDAMTGCNKLVSAVADSLLGLSARSGEGFRACEHLNVSVCYPVTHKGTLPDVIIAVYNPLGWNDLTPWLRIPLHATKEQNDHMNEFTLTEYSTGETIAFQVVSLPEHVLNLPERRMLTDKGHSELVFKPNVGLKPAGFTFFALKGESNQGYGFGYQRQPRQQRFSLSISSENLPVFRTQEGQEITMRLLNYDAANYYKPLSGAYIFRPLQAAIPIGNATSEKIDGELVTEVRTRFTPWASLSARLYADDRMEVQWVVGPLPNINIRVTEVVLRYKVTGEGTLPTTEGEFYTDSMGNDLIRRLRSNLSIRSTSPWMTSTETTTTGGRSWWSGDARNYWIQASYFPVVNRIMLKGERYAFAIYTDRSEGGSSLADGEVELMLHRATTVDDGLGVGEPLNEKAFGEGIVVKGLHRLIFDTLDKVEVIDPRMAQEVSRPVSLFFRDRPANSAEHFSPPMAAENISLLVEGLPHGLHLLTAQRWPVENAGSPNTQILLRLQHLAGPGVGAVTVDLSNALTVGRVVRTTEMTLTANQVLTAAQANALVWPDDSGKWRNGRVAPGNGTLVTLQPGEIKTLVLELEQHHHYWKTTQYTP